MARVFVSYSRKDIEFAKRLTAELQKSELDFWIDWEGIPPTVDWWKEIEKGIEEADAFLFFISPDSAKSKICAQEIDTAVKNGKRIIPIVVREVQWENTPAQLGHLNYIFFSRDDDFDTAVKKLMTAIQTDYEWAATHRRLQVRALEWERKNRENSFLLRGKDLQEAELQLATNSSKDPYPTDLQREHIFASRKDGDRQRRVVRAISVAAIIALAALAVFGFYQAGQATNNAATAQANLVVAQTARADAQNNAATAIANQEEAERQAQIALSRQLASQAQSINLTRSSDQLVSMLLAVQSMKMFPNGEAASFLINNNRSVPIMSQWSDIGLYSYNPDGQLLVVSGCEKHYGNGSCMKSYAAVIETATEKLLSRKGYGNDVAVSSVVLSPDGKRVVSSSNDGMVREWEARTGRDIFQVRYAGWANYAFFSQDGNYMASRGCDRTDNDGFCMEGSVSVWDAATGKKQISVAYNGWVQSAAFSTNGKYLITSGCDKVDSKKYCLQGSARSFEILTGREADLPSHKFGMQTTFLGPDDKYGVSIGCDEVDKEYYCLKNSAIVWEFSTGREITRVSFDVALYYAIFSPDGKYLLANGCDVEDPYQRCQRGSLRIWDLATGTEFPIGYRDDVVYSAAFSPDSKLAAFGNQDGILVIWDLAAGKELVHMTHDDLVYALGFSPDGKSVVSGSHDKTARVWDIATGKEISLMTHQDWIDFVGFAIDGKYIFSHSRDGDLRVWQIAHSEDTSSLLALDGLYWHSLAFSPNGRYVASAYPDHTVRVLEISTGNEVARIQHGDLVFTVAFSQDGKYVASGGNDRVVRVWDTFTGKEIAHVTHDAHLNSIAFSSDGKYVASSGNDNTVRVWESLSGKEIARITHDNVVNSVAFSLDGKYVVSGSNDNTARVWEVANGKEIARRLHDNGVTSVSFSLDGKYIISGSWDQTARVWEATTGKEIARVTHGSGVVSVAFSLDGKYVVSGSYDGTARVWEATTGKEVANMPHDGVVYSVAFSPDGKYIVAASADKTVRVWEISTVREVASFLHDHKVMTALFSPDGEYIASTDTAYVTHIWEWRAQDLIDNACAVITQNLTLPEWKQYIGELLPYQAVCDNLPIEPE